MPDATNGAEANKIIAIGGPDDRLPGDEVRSFIRRAFDDLDLDGRTLCLVIPDATRRCPLPLLLSGIADAVIGRVASVTAVVALGTHAPLDAAELANLVGDRRINVVNHAWWDPEAFVEVGQLTAADVAGLSGGLLAESVTVRVNRLVVESDVTVIVGPVLPHEVVGFSGGEKYLFPGLSGPELIDLTHWLGALITSADIIGTRGITPVRAMIHAAAAMVQSERRALSVVVARNGPADLHAAAFGPPVLSWDAAAAVAEQTHVTYLQRPVARVLSLVADRYDDLWTGAKGFYKVEPVVADGGEVVLFAPHITTVSAMHPALDVIGYHCRDYFVAQWDQFRDYRWGELAHSTHLAGAGTYDPEAGEVRRVRVTLATGISEDRCRALGLGYRDPATIDPAAWASDPDTLVVHDAGEVLHRLR